MVRESKKKVEDKEGQQNPEVLARKRLKALAFSNNILSETPAKTRSPLSPSTAVLKHHGKDLLRKSQRKNRFLFSFPGLLAPITGGKIGELKDLSTKNPVLYLDFPQGQIKLFGTIVYPKNKYLTLQFSRGGKNVLCEDYFDNMIVFSDAWWIGTKEENPDEVRLDFPKELTEGQPGEHDFKGGAGALSTNKQVSHKKGPKFEEPGSPETEFKYDSEDVKQITPVRHSERTAKKKFKFVDVSSGDDSVEADAGISQEEDEEAQEEEEEKKENEVNTSTIILNRKNGGSGQLSLSVNKSRKLSEPNAAASLSKDSGNNRGPLVQATISTLFNKVQEKKHVEDKEVPKSSRNSPSSKVSDQKLKQSDSKRKLSQMEGARKRGKVAVEENASNDKGTGTKAKEKVLEVDDDDDIEDISSSSQDSEGSDEDWAV